MKDLTKRFINVHSGLGPLGPSLQPSGLEGAKLGGEATAQLQLAQLYGQYGYTGLQGQGVALQPLQPQYLVHGIQGVDAGGQGVSHQQQQGLSWMYSNPHNLLSLAQGTLPRGPGLAYTDPTSYFQPGLGSYQLPSGLGEASLLASKALPPSIYSSPSTLSPPLYCPSSTSPPLDPSSYLQFQPAGITVLPHSSLALLNKMGLGHPSKPSYKSYSDKKRSLLLEEFRNNLLPALSLAQLAGHVVEFAEDQHGSRFIQQKLESASLQDKEAIFQELHPSCFSLMTDVFGNYVIQKFFQHGTEEQRTQLLAKILPHMESLTVQMYGCRIIQKALETMGKEQQLEIVEKLEACIEDFVKDQNGNHVIQKCIEVVDPNHCQFILDAFKGKAFVTACHPFGCRVVQRVLEHCTPEQISPLLEELLGNTDQLLQDQYGNYVIQHILDRGRPEHKARIVQCVSGRVVGLSQHKFASNVVEKCVSNAGPEERAALIREVCQGDPSESCPSLGLMIRDQYANYVVQKMIDTGGPEELALLMARIRLHISALHKFTYGKHILAKLEAYYAKQQ